MTKRPTLQEVITFHSERPEVVEFLDRRIAGLQFEAHRTLSWPDWNEMTIWEKAMFAEYRPIDRRKQQT